MHIVKAICFEISDRKITKKNAIYSITNQVNELWQRAEIPTVSKKRVKAKISEYFEKYYSLFKANSNSSAYIDKVKFFQVKYANNIFMNL